MQKLTASLTIALSLCALSAKSHAQHPSAEGWNFSIGTGTIVSPVYLGDNSYQFMAVPNFRVTYGDKFFASVQEGIGYNYLQNENWRIGPLARYDFGRDEDGRSPFQLNGRKTNDLRGLGDVDGTLELGGFVAYSIHPVTMKVEMLQGIGGHEGFIGSADLSYSGQADISGQAVRYSVGPDIKFAGKKFHETYFGVNASQSAASGLTQYSPDSGVLHYGFGGSAIVPITDNFSAVLFSNYRRLGDEASDSSLVSQRGSSNQFVNGLFVNYNF
ncbi:MAG: MipA/OmpV family protein [Alphaproteobacteria bacterium]